MSLTLRLALSVVVLLLLVVLGTGLLVERQVLSTVHLANQTELKQVTLRAADALQQYIQRLRADVSFLARTQPLRNVQPNAGHRLSDEQLAELQRLFRVVAQSKPGYVRIRLIDTTAARPGSPGAAQGASALIDVVQGLPVPNASESTYAKALRTPPGKIYLALDKPAHSAPAEGLTEATLLRAFSPIGDGNATHAMLEIDLNLHSVFQQMTKLLPYNATLFVSDEHGSLLFHPDPQRPRLPHFQLSDLFPELTDWPTQALPEAGEFPDALQTNGTLAYAVQRALGDTAAAPHLTLLALESGFSQASLVGMLHNDLYLTVGGLVALAVVLGILVIISLTRPLRGLAQAARALSRGEYDIKLPQPRGRSDIARLTRVFQRMIDALRLRERHLTEWNLQLERQILERTRQLEASRSNLAAQRALQALILENLVDGVVAIDKDSTFTLSNQRINDIFGIQVNEVPVERWPQSLGLYRTESGELLSLEDIPLCRALHGQTVPAQEIFVCNEHLPSGLWVSMFARPLRDPNDRVDGAVAVISDIQERHRMAQQRDARSQELARVGRLSAIAQIVDTATHQLSQPLSAIANYAGAALKLRAAGRLDDAKLEEILDNVGRLAERGGESLHTLRSLLPTGRLPLSEIDINEVVTTTLSLLNDRVEQLGIALQTQLTPGLPRIAAYRDQIYQALVHLLGNALDALDTSQTPPRRLWIVTEGTASHLRIRIGDNGPQVPAELHEAIFDPWFSTKAGALGIGLSVVRNIAQSHNGGVTLDQGDDGVTWFTLELPTDI